jgi:hypothetical protein
MRSLVLGIIFSIAALPAVAAINTLPPPVVVVYPLLSGGNADPQAGGRLAILFASRLSTAGGITVKPATPGTPRAQYLDAARALGADYYVTGYLTPLGDEVSLVDQLVSTYSGIVVWSNTAQVRTYDEAAGQANLLRDAILRHAGRTLAALDQPAPLPSTTSTPAGNSGNLSHLFSKRPKPTPAPPKPAITPTPAPKQVAAAPAPSTAGARASAAPSSRTSAAPPPVTTGPVAIVVAIDGSADAKERSYAATALAAAVAKRGLGGALVTTSTTGEAPAHARELCSAHAASSILGGTLAVEHVGGAFFHGATADLELIRYDCTGQVAGRQRAQMQASGRSDTTVAIDRAIAKDLDAVLRPPAAKAR